jgi:DNA-binding transcriptional LysR family regulator
MDIRDLDLNLLVVLDALLRERNVTRAARRLGRSQSTISGALARLRAAVGDPLFIRSDAGVLPTERALSLGDTVTRALLELRSALARDAEFTPTASRRSFAIEVSEEAAVVVLPKLIHELQRGAPSVRLRAVRFEGHEPSEALRSGDVDLALGVVKRVAAPFEREVVRRLGVMTVGRRGHPLLKKRIGLPAYARAAHVLVSPRGKPLGLVDSALRAHDLVRHNVTVVPSLASALLTVLSSDLLLTTGEAVAQTLAEGAPLSLSRLPLDFPAYDLVMLWHARQAGDPGHAWLREQVREVGRQSR